MRQSREILEQPTDTPGPARSNSSVVICQNTDGCLVFMVFFPPVIEKENGFIVFTPSHPIPSPTGKTRELLDLAQVDLNTKPPQAAGRGPLASHRLPWREPETRVKTGPAPRRCSSGTLGTRAPHSSRSTDRAGEEPSLPGSGGARGPRGGAGLWHAGPAWAFGSCLRLISLGASARRPRPQLWVPPAVTVPLAQGTSCLPRAPEKAPEAFLRMFSSHCTFWSWQGPPWPEQGSGSSSKAWKPGTLSG